MTARRRGPEKRSAQGQEAPGDRPWGFAVQLLPGPFPPGSVPGILARLAIWTAALTIAVALIVRLTDLMSGR